MAELEILMLGYQRGDSAATTVLIRQVSPLLLRFFTSQCGNRSEAEDLLQDTWLQIHKARHTHRPGEPVLCANAELAAAHRVVGVAACRITATSNSAFEETDCPFNASNTNANVTIRSDGAGNSFVYIPSLKAMVTGDIVFDHVYFGVTRDKAREDWNKTIEQITALQPAIIVPGHEGPGAPATCVRFSS